MYEPPRWCRNFRLASPTIPRSITQVRFARPYLASMAVTIVAPVLESLVLPSKTSSPSGIPSVVTTRPMQTCRQSGRLSRE